MRWLLAILLFCSFETRDCLRDWCFDQLKVREQGFNSGTEVEKYLASCHLQDTHNPYCACFALTGFLSCGIDNFPKDCPAQVVCWFKEDVIWERGIKETSIPQKCDLASFYFPQMGRDAHMGVILIWDTRNGVALIEAGNTNEAGSREGDGVYQKIYSISQIHKVTDKITKTFSPKYHIVQKKENLYRISLMYNVQLSDLMALNGLSGNDIFVGQKLRVR